MVALPFDNTITIFQLFDSTPQQVQFLSSVF